MPLVRRANECTELQQCMQRLFTSRPAAVHRSQRTQTINGVSAPDTAHCRCTAVGDSSAACRPTWQHTAWLRPVEARIYIIIFYSSCPPPIDCSLSKMSSPWRHLAQLGTALGKLLPTTENKEVRATSPHLVELSIAAQRPVGLNSKSYLNSDLMTVVSAKYEMFTGVFGICFHTKRPLINKIIYNELIFTRQ